MRMFLIASCEGVLDVDVWCVFMGCGNGSCDFSNYKSSRQVRNGFSCAYDVIAMAGCNDYSVSYE